MKAPGATVSRPTTVLATALAGALVTALAGCASIDASRSEGLSGRLSVRVEAASGEPARSLSGAFELSGDAERGSLSLSTPFGTVLAQALWSPQQVLLVTPQGQTAYADLRALTHAMIGEELPLAVLFDWLRGRPWAGAESRAASPPAQAGFLQLGWQVTLTRFDDGYVEAQRLEPPVVTVRARMDRR